MLLMHSFLQGDCQDVSAECTALDTGMSGRIVQMSARPEAVRL